MNRRITTFALRRFYAKGFEETEAHLRWDGLAGRILNTGDILVKTQSEKDFMKRIVKVRDPLKAADLIRGVMTWPIFRMNNSGVDRRL